MSINQKESLDFVIRNGYVFIFDYKDLSIRAGGSPITGKEYVYVNDELVSSAKTRADISTHEFCINQDQYRVEFEVISKADATLACRLYCNGELVKLFAAAPKRLFFTRPLFFISVILALLIHDSIVTTIPMGYVLVSMVALVLADILYPMTHVKIMELEV